MPEKMSGARAIVEALEREKVEYIFGMPGGANLPFYDALWDSKIKHVLCQARASWRPHGGRLRQGLEEGRGLLRHLRSRAPPTWSRGSRRPSPTPSPMVAITGQVSKGMTGRNALPGDGCGRGPHPGHEVHDPASLCGRDTLGRQEELLHRPDGTARPRPPRHTQGRPAGGG